MCCRTRTPDREEQMAAPVAAITVFAAADAPPKVGGKQMEKEMAKQYAACVYIVDLVLYLVS